MAERISVIPGIIRLAQREEDIRNKRESIVPGVWYVYGIRSDTGKFQDTNRIAIKYLTDIEAFRTLNERINQRFTQKKANYPELKEKEGVLIK